MASDEQFTTKYLAPFSVKNVSGETAPAFGVAMISDASETTLNEESVIEITKPDGSGGLHVILGPAEIPDGKYGIAYRGFGSFALYSTDGDDPVLNDEWGPEADSWMLV